MKIGKAIYNILVGTALIEARVDTRIFPMIAPQTSAFPFIVYDVNSVDPSDTKDGASDLDTISTMVSVYSKTYAEASILASLVRNALDRKSGTFNGIEVGSIQFRSYNDIFESSSDSDGIFRIALDFGVRQVNPRSA